MSAKGLEQLLQTVSKVKRQINPRLKIEGILLTMVDSRTNCAKEISSLIRETYGGRLESVQHCTFPARSAPPKSALRA